MIISTDWLTWFFIVYCTIPNLFIIAVYNFIRLKQLIKGKVDKKIEFSTKERKITHLTMMIPAYNEQKVLKNTVRSILKSTSDKKLNIECDILIINDNSTDGTDRIIKALMSEFPQKIHLVERKGSNSRKGKAETLNEGAKFLRNFLLWRQPKNWVIGVSDADAEYSSELFVDVLRKFNEENCDAVQCAVRIKNNHLMLTKFQDTEFLAFSKLVQRVREYLDGTVFLGGNAQFITFKKLLELYKKNGYFWHKNALTEDLDISIRLHMLGAKIGFSNYAVFQEGVETIKALFRQRKRWARGTIQAFRQFILNPEFYSSPMSFSKKVTIFYYLTFWTIPIIVGATIIIGLPLIFLGKYFDVYIQNSFPYWLMLLNSFSFLPLVFVGMKTGGYTLKETILVGLLTPFYSYHWFWPVLKGCLSELRNENVVWAKTERYSAIPAPSTYQGG